MKRSKKGGGGEVQDVWTLPFYTHGIRNRLVDDVTFLYGSCFAHVNFQKRKTVMIY